MDYLYQLVPVAEIPDYEADGWERAGQDPRYLTHSWLRRPKREAAEAKRREAIAEAVKSQPRGKDGKMGAAPDGGQNVPPSGKKKVHQARVSTAAAAKVSEGRVKRAKKGQSLAQALAGDPTVEKPRKTGRPKDGESPDFKADQHSSTSAQRIVRRLKRDAPAVADALARGPGPCRGSRARRSGRYGSGGEDDREGAAAWWRQEIKRQIAS